MRASVSKASRRRCSSARASITPPATVRASQSAKAARVRLDRRMRGFLHAGLPHNRGHVPCPFARGASSRRCSCAGRCSWPSITIALKTLAWWLTGSVGLLSDAMESLVNLAGAAFALLMVRIAQRPADADHPYGHHKAEYFSAGFEG